jgi:hypothetical protein
MSSQFGNIVGDTAPALLSLLHQFAPLFASIGNELARGAAMLNNWAHNTTGVRSFVAYVQAELPHVEQFLGEVITLISHLAQGSANFGGQVLVGLTGFVRVLNAIPIGVLQVAVPLAVSLYTAFKAYGLVKTLIDGTSKAVTVLGTTLGIAGPKAEAFAAQQTAAALQVELAAAREAEAVAAAKAEESAAAAEAAVNIAASAEAQNSVLAAGAAATAEYAIEEAAAFKLAADAAVANAARIAEAAAAAARAQQLAAESASASSLGMLGPIGIAVGAVALFGLTMSNSGQDAQEAKLAQDSYSDSVEKSTDALSKANVAQTQDNLAKSGAYAQLQKLHDLNVATSLSTLDLTMAVNGSAEAYQRVMGQLQDVIDSSAGGDSLAGMFTDQGKAALSAQGDLMKYRDGLVAQIQQQRLLTEAQRAQQQADNGGEQATLAAARALGVSRNAYLDAQVAAKKNTETTKQQTLAFQLERDAAGLLEQALKTLAGQTLGVAEAKTAMHQAVIAARKALDESSGSLKGNTEKTLAAKAAIQQQVEAARSAADAIAKQTHSNDKAIESYKNSKQALLDDLAAHHQLTPAVRDYIDRLYDVKGVSDYLNNHPVAPKVKAPDTSDTQAKLDKIVTTMQTIGNGVTAVVNIHTVNTATGAGNTVKAQAAGGPVDGPGARGVDSQLRLLAPGEWVINDKAVAALTAKYGPGALPMINRGALPGPGPVSMPATSVSPGGGGSSASVALAAAQAALTPEALRAALHGARLAIDPSLMHATIDTRAGGVVRDYVSFQDDL